MKGKRTPQRASRDAELHQQPSGTRGRPRRARTGFSGVPIAAAASLALLGACGSEMPAPPVSPPPPAPAPAPAPSATADAPKPDAPAYSGHGASSVPPDVVARYAPPPLSAGLRRRIQALLDVRAPSAGMPTPDGKALLFGWTITGTRQVFRIDGPQRFPTQLTGGEDPTVLVEVTPDGKHLVLSRDRQGEENPGVYLQAAGGGPLVAVKHEPGVRAIAELVSDDSKWLYFRANDRRKDAYAIYRHEIASGRQELVFEAEGLWSLADVGKDGRLLLAKDVGSNMSEYFEYAPATKTLTPLFGQGEREEHDAVYGAREGEILVQTPKLGDNRRLYVFKGGKLTPITPEIPHDVDSFSIDRAKKRIAYHVNEGGYTRLHAIDAKTFEPIPLPKLPAADHVTLVATTPDGRFSTLSIDTGAGLPEGHVLDWQTKKLVKWHAPSAPEIDASSFARAKLEHYPARDGTTIPMFVRRPEKCAETPCPVIVSFHGGPEAQAKPGFNVRPQLFVDAGFVFVEPNVRGSDGYGRQWLHADDGAKRLDIITDIEDCAKYIKTAWAEGGKAPKVGVMGGSYGGYSALIAMTMFAGAYDAGASVVGIGNLVTFLENTAPYRRILRISEYGDPVKDRDVLLRLSPVTYVDRVCAPLLVIQGVTDPRVPVGEALLIHRALDAKGVPSQLVLFADEGHGAQKRDNQVLQFGHIVRFFRTHLLGEKDEKGG